MLAWLRNYRPDWLRPDLLAGLITAFVPMGIYAVLGSSQVLSVSA